MKDDVEVVRDRGLLKVCVYVVAIGVGVDNASGAEGTEDAGGCEGRMG
jgi:hypothetical protein